MNQISFYPKALGLQFSKLVKTL